MTDWEAIARKDSLTVYQGSDSYLDPILNLDVGLEQLGGNEGCTDALSEQGWEQIEPWHLDRDGASLWAAVAPLAVIPEPQDNGRRMDVAVALSEEDDREGESRDIRSRVDFAMDFERSIRDRKEFPA